MRLLALLTDAYGGRGGIAKFNRDLLEALCAYPACREVVVLPRVVPDAPGDGLPDELTYRTEAVGSKLNYAWHVARCTFRESRSAFEAVVCGHVNLLPLAVLAARWHGVPLLLVMHGIEVWEPTGGRLTHLLLAQVDTFVAVSDFTRRRFLQWAPLSDEQGRVVPDCIDTVPYGPGPKREDLLARYGLTGRPLLMTFGRLSASEQYKGHDEVLEVLPALVEEHPDLAYLVCGDGDDRPRLEAKARRLGLSDCVVFAGYVPEEEKADHYRLADAFVMPGRGEGFGIVYLEALACGVPVVASRADASREAVRGGRLGAVVDPDDPADLKRGIREALGQQRGTVPDGLDYFSKERFTERWHRLIDDCFGKPDQATMRAV